MLLTGIKNLKSAVVPTALFEVNPSPHPTYPDVVYVERFGDMFKLVGGINQPKLVECFGSDGRTYKQLVKGKDDLRQDAVMQQVFVLVDVLLKKNAPTKQRRLRMRTYKVIPLAMRSGLLEWVDNTQTLLEFLKKAHPLYRPQDITLDEARTEMTTMDGKRYERYTAVTKNLKPVFRHFFFENFCDPALWFEQRLRYTRSVASSSMISYIVGLGDRHCSNILIDKKTAEVVHIDLGVAFEQGKMLKIPEVVPFRLTRDMVDGMGITGVEGIFRRSCEETMRVLRAESEAVMTILEVLQYDPLYNWSLSQQKINQLQEQGEIGAPSREEDNNKGPSNQEADRALRRVKQKLQGLEVGTFLNVSGQVNHLIQSATDPHNLSKMFHGWFAVL